MEVTKLSERLDTKSPPKSHGGATTPRQKCAASTQDATRKRQSRRKPLRRKARSQKPAPAKRSLARLLLALSRFRSCKAKKPFCAAASCSTSPAGGTASGCRSGRGGYDLLQRGKRDTARLVAGLRATHELSANVTFLLCSLCCTAHSPKCRMGPWEDVQGRGVTTIV